MEGNEGEWCGIGYGVGEGKGEGKGGGFRVGIYDLRGEMMRGKWGG